MFNFLFFRFLHLKKFEIITWLRHRPRNFHLGFHLRKRKTKNKNKNPKNSELLKNSPYVATRSRDIVKLLYDIRKLLCDSSRQKDIAKCQFPISGNRSLTDSIHEHPASYICLTEKNGLQFTLTCSSKHIVRWK